MVIIQLSRFFEDCFPHHSLRIPQIGVYGELYGRLHKWNKTIKKEGEPFGFSLLIVFMVLD
jgi:hypothetical protein